ncbi:MAG: oxidoreductase, partial [Bacteroidota bacterium]|nr:oxidoreductase [Bacteroidota bacterium]
MKHLFSMAIILALSTLTILSFGNRKPVKSIQKAKVSFTGAPGEVKLITLDPGHFHASLVQKNMYPQVNPDVYVYAPKSADLGEHLKRIE